MRSRFLDYDKDENGEFIINREEAEVVKRIYRMYLDDYGPTVIANTLTNENIPTPGGKNKWCPSTIRSILSNEKYKGDALFQKSFTLDY